METEEQQLEEIRHWWKEHGNTVIAGIVLGLGTVIGWTTWRDWQESSAQELSARYEMIVVAASKPGADGVREMTDELIADHPDSAYASLAALVGAHAAYNNNDAQTAQRLLNWAIEHGEAFDVANVARLRLARIASENGEHDKALQLLDQVGSQEFAALRLETRGDVLSAKSDRSAAKAAFEEALKVQSLQGDARERIQLKLDQLATAGG